MFMLAGVVSLPNTSVKTGSDCGSTGTIVVIEPHTVSASEAVLKTSEVVKHVGADVVVIAAVVVVAATVLSHPP